MSSAEKTLEEKIEAHAHRTNSGDVWYDFGIKTLIKADSAASAKQKKELAGKLRTWFDEGIAGRDWTLRRKEFIQLVNQLEAASSDGEGAMG